MTKRLTGFSPVVRYAVRVRSGGICEICGEQPAQQHHHRRARGMGSTRRPETNMPANALHLCGTDHALVEQYRAEALYRGWLVSQTRTPSEIPVHLHDGCFLLADDGERYSVPCRHEEAA